LNKVIIKGSSRKDGDTDKIVKQLVSISQWDIIDLNDYNINFYDYNHENAGDDYLDLMQKLIKNYEVLIFATPVYWYSMSGIMKVFFDRFTDLLTIEENLGRKLRNKSMAAISCSAGDNLGENFWFPFSETAKYLGMKYLGNIHILADKDETENLKKFVWEINKKSG
jgi:multimeric flavodoxin WrbA